VMHRDIKPANIFIRADGSPVLLDFGAARQALVSHSRSMTSLATAHYAAFEQYSTHGKQGAWTDIYGLAATLYHAATGEKPQDAPDRILEDTLEPLAERAAGQYSENVLKAIDAGLAVRPEDRPQSIKEWRSFFEHSSSQTVTLNDWQETYITSTEYNPKRSVFGAIITALFVCAIIVFMFPMLAIFSGGGSDLVKMEVKGSANARDAPTAKGSNIIGSYSPGEELEGTWVDGESDQAGEKWLKVADGHTWKYVWSGNLIEITESSDLPSAKAPSLSQYMGRYPSSEVEGISFWEHPIVRKKVEQLIGDAGTASLILNGGVETPIQSAGGDYIYAYACQQHNCGSHNWGVSISLDGKDAKVCYQNYDGGRIQSGWYSNQGFSGVESCEPETLGRL